MPPASAPTPPWPSPRIVYHPRYNIGLLGLERLHPFDSRKYGRAWKILRRRFGRKLHRFHVKPLRPMSRAELQQVHTSDYLDKLRDPKFIASVLEMPPLRHMPGWLADYAVLRPMRWATMGTVMAAVEAIEHGIAVNLSGGYHHASPDHGHGFSAYADVGLAVHQLRAEGHLNATDRIAYIDLDAHQGNGVCRTFFDDPRVFIYDQYNQHNFPQDLRAQRRIDCDVPLNNGCTESEYLTALRSQLPPFLDALNKGTPLKLALYNAGTDIYAADQLGGLNVSAAGVLERDKFVLNELIDRKIPTAVVLSGGYSSESFTMVAEMIRCILQTWGGV